MIEKLSSEQLEAILDTLPMNFIFVDENERLMYRNKSEARTAAGAPDTSQRISRPGMITRLTIRRGS